MGTCITPAWFGIHDGSFDLYDRNKALPTFLEPLVEDGNNAPVVAAFAATTGGVVDGMVGNMPLCPAGTATATFNIDVPDGTDLYFSYASMILPSNDAFLANGNPMEHKIFDDYGNFVPVSFVVPGSAALDGGTETNDELPANTAFFGQMVPNTGVTTKAGVVVGHPGFIKLPGGPILSSARFSGADFTRAGYNFVRVTVTAVKVVERTGLIKVTNTAPPMGTCLTPVWVGIHAGQFDTYNRSAPLPVFMEPLVEDGNNAPVAAEFARGDLTNFWDATVGMAPICPGESAELTFTAMVPPTMRLYFSYATMILPSNDAFLSNGDPTMHLVFNGRGTLRESTIVTTGAMVLDGGTENNDELPTNTAFFGQTTPNTGVTTSGGVVSVHPGFNAVKTGGILANSRFAGANFKAAGYQTMTISIMRVGGDLPKCSSFSYWLQYVAKKFGYRFCRW
jgi:hypothetical protein